MCVCVCVCVLVYLCLYVYLLLGMCIEVFVYLLCVNTSAYISSLQYDAETKVISFDGFNDDLSVMCVFCILDITRCTSACNDFIVVYEPSRFKLSLSPPHLSIFSSPSPPPSHPSNADTDSIFIYRMNKALLISSTSTSRYTKKAFFNNKILRCYRAIFEHTCVFIIRPAWRTRSHLPCDHARLVP